MDETTRAIIERITKSSTTPQDIPGGHHEKIFYDCSQLTQAELARLAAHAISGNDVPAFDVVVGMAYRGIAYAAAIAGGRPLGIVEVGDGYTGCSPAGKRVLLVDDVAFQGHHLLEGIEKISALKGTVVACACIVDRSNGSFPIKLPLFSSLVV